jgi:hypothetical protein
MQHGDLQRCLHMPALASQSEPWWSAPAAWPNLIDVRLGRDGDGHSKGFAFLVRSCRLHHLVCISYVVNQCRSLYISSGYCVLDVVLPLQEFTHEDYARALMECPARSRLQFPDAPQPLTLEYSRGRPGGAPGGLCARTWGLMYRSLWGNGASWSVGELLV